MSASVKKSVWIAAPPEAVFDLYSDGTRAKSWLGLELLIEPFAGGQYRLDMELGGIAEGEVVAFERPSHIHHTVSCSGADGTSQIHLSFADEGGGTRVVLLHSGLGSDESAAYAGRTWDHHFARLAVAATGGAPGPDPLLRDFGVPEF